MTYKVLTFATDDEHYQGFAEKFIANCENLGMELIIETIPATGLSKREQCLYKPRFILDHLDDEPLLWVDVDSYFTAKPELPSDGFDVGLCGNPFKGNEVTAGVIYNAPTKASRRFLERWMERCGEWKKGELGSHRRLCQTRHDVDYKELDLTPMMRRKLGLLGARGTVERKV